MRSGGRLKSILDRALAEESLSFSDIKFILGDRDKKEREKIFAAARRLRRRYFDRKLFACGFVYFSTYCRNNCSFCFYRRNNDLSPRYRKNREDVMEISRTLAEAGVHLLDITMGEDPQFYREDQDFTGLVDIVAGLKEELNLPVMVSAGRVPRRVLSDLRRAGADWYACYQETHNREHFSRLRRGQDFDSRLDVKKEAAEKGFLIEEGMLLGTGESREDRVKSVLMMRRLSVDQGRVMSFVPQAGTPMSARNTPPREEEMLMIAAMRLAMPDILIPASLDVEGITGLKPRLRAGANVVTSIIPEGTGLKGVSNSDLDIDGGRRSMAGVRKELEETPFKLAAAEEYRRWIKNRREQKQSSVKRSGSV